MDEKPDKYRSPHTGLYWYKRIPRDEADDEMDAVAARAAEFFASDLEVAVPVVQWVVPVSWEIAENTSDEQARQGEYFSEALSLPGITPFDFKNEILLRHSIDAAQLIRTIAHEMCHVWQEHKKGDWRQRELNAAEDQAVLYEAEACDRYKEYVHLTEPKDQFDIELARALNQESEEECK